MRAKTSVLMAVVAVAAVLIAGWLIVSLGGDASSPANPEAGKQNTAAKKPQLPSFDANAYSIDDPNSIWVVANKKRPLSPPDYVPSNLVVPNIPLRLEANQMEMKLRADAANALEKMVAAAKSDDVQLMLASGYRSYAFQKSLYARYVNQQGQAVADTQSARAGHSEHQTGLAADLEPISRTCEIEACFADTAEGKWLANHAHSYGFIIRYPDDMQSVTGYTYEPWHIRYVGKELAVEMQTNKITTLERFFKLENADTY